MGDNLIHGTALLEQPRKKRGQTIYLTTLTSTAGGFPQLPSAASRLSPKPSDLLPVLYPLRRATIISPRSTRCEVLPALVSALRYTDSTPPCRNAFAEPLSTRRVSSVTTPLPSTLLSLKYSIIPELMSEREGVGGGEEMSNDTNSYEPARPDGM